jgi:hypothetical protein
MALAAGSRAPARNKTHNQANPSKRLSNPILRNSKPQIQSAI